MRVCVCVCVCVCETKRERERLRLRMANPSNMEKKCKKAKWLSGEALQIAVKRRDVKSKGEKER